MAQRSTYRRRLRERALDQYGYVTTHDARDLGIPPVELRKLAQRGFLERVGHGVYRFEDIPRTDRDQFMEAVLCAGPDAALTGDAVLALHDLGLVNPRRIRVAVPRQPRRTETGIAHLIWDRRMDPQAITRYEGIPSQRIDHAIAASRSYVMRERLLDAARQALERGLARKDDLEAALGEALIPS